MKTILLSYFSAARSLARPGVLWHLLWPTLVATVLWTGLLIGSWGTLAGLGNDLMTAIPLVGPWLASSDGVLMVALLMFKIGLVMLALPIIYVTAAFLVAAIALPLMTERVAATDYADLQRRGGGSQIGSIWNALTSVLQFLVLLLLSLPLWLVPGVGLVISLILTAWLNQRAFRYDALMAHADRFELKDLPSRQSSALFGVGMVGAVLAHVPLVNLFAPALSGLAFVHYLLSALRVARRTEDIIEVK
ncbi:EI24 domain-containing protein [Zoogloea sp.]|uniref:EI24 domain-containing protein n=1 Tax=Zoogloea sp. TaxID=49181 RepID=UPI002629ADAD|nr:EI24 domain-containing protein [Zoogloea sp.]MDD3354620.1 EI24 domain-containing protein [Zoogloea sp.]